MFITNCETIKSIRSWKRLCSVVWGEEGHGKWSLGGCNYDVYNSGQAHLLSPCFLLCGRQMLLSGWDDEMKTNKGDEYMVRN